MCFVMIKFIVSQIEFLPIKSDLRIKRGNIRRDNPVKKNINI